MLSSNIFDAKIIHTEVKPNGASDMLPQTRSVGSFEVPVVRQMFLKEFVGK